MKLKNYPRLGLAIYPREELRRALFAAAESCWVYAALLVIGAVTAMPRLLSPISIWFAFWAALEIGHYLPHLRWRWSILQLVNLGLAVMIFMLVFRLDLYAGLPPADFTWLVALPGRLLGLSTRLAPEHVALAVMSYAYLRGVGFGQRPLTLWFVGFQFRLGVLILFFVAIIGAWARSVDLAAPVIAFFIISLVSIALARMQESGREQGLDARWTVLLVIAAGLVVIVGVSVTPLLTIAGAALFFQLFSPLAPVLALVAFLILTPLFWLVGILLDLILPLIERLSEAISRLVPVQDIPSIAPLQAVPQFLAQLGFVLPYLRVIAFLAILFGAGLWVARALNRRMMQDEQETYLREAADPQYAGMSAKPKRAPAARHTPREIQAENIRRIYAALLARAAALGLPRREAETPLEYLPRLAARFPGGTADLQEITNAYVAVHYAEQVVSTERAREVRAIWQRLKLQMGKEGTRIHKDTRESRNKR